MIEIVLFLGYEVAFVIIPGWALVRALRPSLGRLEQLALGWAVGYLLEILGFMLTAALDARSFFLAYPAVALLLVLAVRQLGRINPELDEQRVSVPAFSHREAWGLAAVCALALGFLALALFALMPLPGQAATLPNQPDLSFHVSLAAEAKYHWPLTNPTVAGLDLAYQVWAHLHMAAVSQVTGLSLPLELLRLFPVPLLLLFIIQVAVLGRLVSRNASVGVIAAALALFVGELDFNASFDLPFIQYFSLGLWTSPTFLLGLVLFVPATFLLIERVQASGRVGAAWKSWFLFTLFLVGGSGAKAVIVPVVVGGLCLCVVWSWLRKRRMNHNALTGIAIGSIVWVLFYFLLYQEAGSLGTTLEPLAAVRSMPGLEPVRELFGEGPLSAALAAILGPLGTYGAALVGLPFLLAAHRRHHGVGRLFLFSALVVGLLPYLFLHHPAAGQNWFSNYGFVAACVLSAEGISLLAATQRPSGHRLIWSVLAAGLAWLLSLLLLILVGTVWFQRLSPSVSYGLAGAVILAVFVLLLTRSSRRDRVDGIIALCLTALLVVFFASEKATLVSPAEGPYAFLLVALVALALAAWVASADRRWSFALLPVVGVLAAGTLDIPLDYADRPRFREELIVGQVERDLQEALTWIRDHTDEDAVLAVNVDPADPTPPYASLYVYHSALAERRVFLEGWARTKEALDAGYLDVKSGKTVLFPERLRLNEAVFQRGDAAALRTLVRDHDVRYLLVARQHGPVSPRVEQLGRVVLSSPGATVYEVPPPTVQSPPVIHNSGKSEVLRTRVRVGALGPERSSCITAGSCARRGSSRRGFGRRSVRTCSWWRRRAVRVSVTAASPAQGGARFVGRLERRACGWLRGGPAGRARTRS